MSLRNTMQAYGSVSKFFHWTIFILLLAMILFGYFMDDVPKAYKGLAFNTHKLVGLLILLLMLLRLLWAISNPKPTVNNVSPVERFLEHFVHGLLYLVVIAMPLVGLIGSVAAGRAPYLGDVVFTLPIPESKATSHLAFSFHWYLAIAIIVLVGLHFLAALYHQFIRRDDVLRRMMPRRHV